MHSFPFIKNIGFSLLGCLAAISETGVLLVKHLRNNLGAWISYSRRLVGCCRRCSRVHIQTLVALGPCAVVTLSTPLRVEVFFCQMLQDLWSHQVECGISCIEFTGVLGSCNHTIYIVHWARSLRYGCLTIRTDHNIWISFTSSFCSQTKERWSALTIRH